MKTPLFVQERGGIFLPEPETRNVYFLISPMGRTTFPWTSLRTSAMAR